MTDLAVRDDFDGPVAHDDPNRCPACVAGREICAEHLAVMNAQAIAAVAILDALDAHRNAELARMDDLAREAQ